jgi:hypothetical protein
MAKDKKPVASFFFGRGSPDHNTSFKLWPMLASQIAEWDEQLKMQIEKAIMKPPGIFSKSLTTQLETLIVEPLTLTTLSESTPTRWHLSRLWPLGRFLSPPPPTSVPKYCFLLIIDLDECEGDEEQCRVLSSIFDIIHGYALPLRFLITSRPEHHIHRSFERPDFENMYLPISLDDLNTSVEDVYMFFQSKFGRLYTNGQLRQRPCNHILRNLADRSGGLFIYAVTILRFIDDEGYLPTDQLKIVLNASHVASTRNPFLLLDLLYQQTLSPCENRPLLLRILGCILIAQKQLSVLDIEHLLSLPGGTVDMTLRRIHSLLHIPKDEKETIYVYHKSLLDFIIDSDRAGEYYMDLIFCHLDLARCCLRILTSPGSWYVICCIFACLWH